MRLIQTASLKFAEFFDSNIPLYAILSHRWTDKEVSFQDFEGAKEEFAKIQSSPRRTQDQMTYNFSKINDSCELAKRRGLQWIWIDTCCIDKKSSAELSEAINSMYRWYAKAAECYVYLLDVTPGEQTSEEDFRTMFLRSSWFTRGWTLQELLAPSEVRFYDYEWRFINDKDSLREEISIATGIDPEDLLKGRVSSRVPSIAIKMSWASRRKTSRIEDMAYCLLGLFDVNMPLLYGEGNKAFLRLQMEIIKVSNDESIFAWTTQRGHSGLLASCPEYFATSGDVVNTDYNSPLFRPIRRPYSMTNMGMEFYYTKNPSTNRTSSIGLPITLNCYRGDRMQVLDKNTTQSLQTDSAPLLDVGSTVLREIDSVPLLEIRVAPIQYAFGSNEHKVFLRVDCHSLEPSATLQALRERYTETQIGPIYIPQNGLHHPDNSYFCNS